jgi:hypothetical protein
VSRGAPAPPSGTARSRLLRGDHGKIGGASASEPMSRIPARLGGRRFGFAAHRAFRIVCNRFEELNIFLLTDKFRQCVPAEPREKLPKCSARLRRRQRAARLRLSQPDALPADPVPAGLLGCRGANMPCPPGADTYCHWRAQTRVAGESRMLLRT